MPEVSSSCFWTCMHSSNHELLYLFKYSQMVSRGLVAFHDTLMSCFICVVCCINQLFKVPPEIKIQKRLGECAGLETTHHVSNA